MGLYENMKELVSLIQKADNLELQKKLLDLQNDVMGLTAVVKRLPSVNLRTGDGDRRLTTAVVIRQSLFEAFR